MNHSKSQSTLRTYPDHGIVHRLWTRYSGSTSARVPESSDSRAATPRETLRGSCLLNAEPSSNIYSRWQSPLQMQWHCRIIPADVLFLQATTGLTDSGPVALILEKIYIQIGIPELESFQCSLLMLILIECFVSLSSFVRLDVGTGEACARSVLDICSWWTWMGLHVWGFCENMFDYRWHLMVYRCWEMGGEVDGIRNHVVGMGCSLRLALKQHASNYLDK